MITDKKSHFGLVVVLVFALLIPLSVSAGQEKTGVCHIDDGGEYTLISIADPALEVHLSHGDKEAGTSGLDENCSPLPLRYIDNGDGTVTDTRTGIIWLQDASCLGGYYPPDVFQQVAALNSGECGLTDGSVEGDWRLPTKQQWEATIADAVALGCVPALTDAAGTGCISDETESIFTYTNSLFWTSTRVGISPDWYLVSLESGTFYGQTSESCSGICIASSWPIRVGQ